MKHFLSMFLKVLQKPEMHNNWKFIFNTVNLIPKEPRATSEFNFIVMQLTDNNVIRKSAMQE